MTMRPRDRRRWRLGHRTCAPASTAARCRVACDSFVALAERTATGHTIFAKNSDRPAGECQPWVHIAAADHGQAKLRCQYIEIEQVRHTYGVLGAGPYWLWGLEHGVNECGVAIGNHTIFTKDAVAQTGLQGMDLVRLGLERASSAEQAAEVIVELIERYGQGGSGYADVDWPYHNSFLVADPHAAVLVEASARNWAIKRVHGAASASNHTVIANDWDRLSSACIAHAREMGWFEGAAEADFDFAAAYRDLALAPPVISEGRFATTCALVDAARAGDEGGGGEAVDVARVKRLLRDHYGSGDVFAGGSTPERADHYSVCMHADPVGTTTASMVVELAPAELGPRVVWAALGNPCASPYLPLFLEGALPEALARGGRETDSGGAWWLFHQISARVTADPTACARRVRDVWDSFERDTEPRLSALLETLASADAQSRARSTGAFMQETCQRAIGAAERLLDEIG